MTNTFENYLKHILFTLIAVVFLQTTAISQCTSVLKTSPSNLSGCEDFTVQFYDSTDTDPSFCIIQTRRWNFGDGSAFTGTQNPVHVYSAGVNGDTTYTAWLAIQDQFNNWDSTSVSINVFKKPFVEFAISKDTICAFNESFCTTNLSDNGAGYEFLWDFETGFSTKYDTCYTYDAEGDYTIRLSVTDDKGCINSFGLPIAVNEIPNPDFTITPFSGCHPIEATFDNTTNAGTFPITAWAWDFAGNGSSTTMTPAPISFSTPGLFAIKLSATNSAGCTNTTENNFLVRETPTASIGYSPEACVMENAMFFYNGTGTVNSIVEWEFTDALIGSETGPGPLVSAWSNGGEYEVQLIVTENACSDTIVETIKINDLPIVTLTSDASGDSICEAEPITFTAMPDSFVTYQFLDQGISVQDSTINTYITDTLKNPNEITIVATDSNNCASSASSKLQITVLTKPVSFLTSTISSDTICKGDIVTFNATGNYDSYSFFDGFLVKQNSSSNSYSLDDLEDGRNIFVTPTHLGCEGYPSNQINTTVIEPLKTPQLNCGASTTNSVSWTWDDIENSKGYEISIDGGPFENPNFGPNGYFKPGMINGDSSFAIVQALGEFPCGNSLESDTITCIATPCTPVSFVQIGKIQYCENDTVEIGIRNITGQGPFSIYWNDSLSSDSNNTYISEDDSTIIVQLIDLGQPSCPIFKYNISLISYPLPTFNLITNVDTICKNDEIIISSDTAGYSNYSYSVNGVILQDSAYHIVNTSFNTDLNKEIILETTNKGCTYRDTSNIFVVPTPPNTISLLSDTICEGEYAYFSGTTGYNRYEFHDRSQQLLYQDSTIHTFSILASDDQDIFMEVKAINENGCSSLYAADTAIVRELPRFNISSNVDSICIGSPANIRANKSYFDHYELFQNYSQIDQNDSGIFSVPDPENGIFYNARATDKGCIGPFTAPISIKTQLPMETPQPNCGTTGNGKITFVWDQIQNAPGYIIQINTDPLINLASTASYSLSGLNAGDTVRFKMMAAGNNSCGPSEMSEEIYCIMPCEGVTYTLNNPIDRFCIGDSLKLSISNINIHRNNYLSKWTNHPIGKDTVKNYLLNASGTYNYQIELYDTTQIHCPPTIKKHTIIVDSKPVVNLSGPTQICGDTSITFNATPTTYDRYAFFDGYVKIQDTINPEVIDLEAEDGHFYRVFTTNGACTDTSNTITVEVTQPLQTPDLYCGQSGLDSISLNFDSVPNADGYQISVNGFPWTTPNGNFVHVVRNLQPEDTLNFQIRAIGQLPCGPGPRSQTVHCVAKPCHYKNFTFPDDTIICLGDSILVEAINPISISNQRGYSWNFGNHFTSVSQYKFSPLNDTTISLRLIDSTELQCPYVEKEMKIEIHDIPIFNLDNSTSNDTVCEGEIVVFTADTAGFDLYQMYINNFLVQDSNYFSFQTDSMNDGSHLVYMTAYDDICYFTSDTQTITIVSFPELVLTTSDLDLEICQEDTIEFTANQGFDEYNFYEIRGTDTTLISSGIDSAFRSNSLVDGSTIFVEGINANTCSKTTASFNFKVNPIPNPIITSSDPDNIICGLDTLTFTISPDTLDNYEFYTNDTLLDFGSHVYITDSLKPGNGIYVIATEDGCSKSSDTISTSVEFTPVVITGADTNEICIGDTIHLWVSGGDSKTWSTGETTDTITVIPQVNTDYWVTGTTGNCTSPIDTFIIDIDDDIPTPYAGDNSTICIGDSLELTASGGQTYVWYPNDSVTAPFADFGYAIPTTTQFIKLEAKNTHCIRTDSLLLTIDLCLSELPDGIPNGVTPNEDGTNDTWDIPYIWYFTDNSLKIYNRWSNLVFEQDGYDGTWKGTRNNGNSLPDGTYFYVLDLGNGRDPYLGYIIIHR